MPNVRHIEGSGDTCDVCGLKVKTGDYGRVRAALGCALGISFLFNPGIALTAENWVRVETATFTNRLQAYARIEPVAVLPIRAALAGSIKGLSALVGQPVHAGEKLAELDGPEIAALQAQDRAAVESARTNLSGAEQLLEVAKRQLTSHLSTLQTVAQAEGELAKAQANVLTAESQLHSLQGLTTLKAPTDGTLLAVQTSNGERVSAGETILIIQPADSLWVKADYYGSSAPMIQVGMSGEFRPASGGNPIPVTVTSIAAKLASDESESVGLTAAAGSPAWLNGERGEVILNGEVRSLVAVPTRALVLDQGQYWVLLRTNKGNVARAVIPGPTRGWNTFIEQGLEPGSEVIVENAYLEFHQNISKKYAPPD